VSVGEQRHPGWVLEHPGHATRWMRAATTFMVPKEEGAHYMGRGDAFHRRKVSAEPKG
jgi:hypothetical protein